MSRQIISFGKISKTVTAAGTAEPLSDVDIYVTDIEIFVPSGNSGANAYIGSVDVDNTWIPRAKGSSYNFIHGTGVMSGLGHQNVLEFNLKNIYADVDTSGDAVIIQYLKKVRI